MVVNEEVIRQAVDLLLRAAPAGSKVILFDPTPEGRPIRRATWTSWSLSRW
ncbi:MAG: hypothetical protein NTU94_16535 [Planctomycetota bacterium]|nr:hypothetical protein [Planctomycetota bacterium]